MTRKLDIGSSNPRLQCACCGQWKRLHGRDDKGNAIQRFYGSCEVTGGDHPFGGDVCAACCPQKCANRLTLNALKRAARLFDEALPRFNFGASALDANAIQLLNEVPGEARAAIAKVEGRS